MWDSEFRPVGGELVFGDQEEMGFGVRVATPLTVKSGGRIVNSDGATDEKQVWGKPADWCDYGGAIENTTTWRVLMSRVANVFVKEVLGLTGIATVSSFYRLYRGRDHVSLVAGNAALDADLIAWTRDRFTGAPDTPNCPR